MRILFTLCLLVQLVGCASQVEDLSLDEITEQQEVQEVFEVRDGWYFEETIVGGELSTEQGRVLLYKNTEQEIIIGGRSPEREDLERYAASFIAIRILVYEGRPEYIDQTWESFFAENYAEVISFESMSIDSSDIDMVTVTEVDGIWFGSERLFVHMGDRFYDVSLHLQDAEMAKAKDAFNYFVLNYNF